MPEVLGSVSSVEKKKFDSEVFILIHFIFSTASDLNNLLIDSYKLVEN
jgi:hypothetical protein